MAKRKTQADVDRETRAAERAQNLQAQADARKDQRNARHVETVAEQRERQAKERVERERSRADRAARARNEKAKLQAEREGRKAAATGQIAAERERERMKRQAEADTRKLAADTERRRRRFVGAGWAPALILAVEGSGDFRAMMRGNDADDAIVFTEARELESPEWIALVTDTGEIQVRLGDILVVSCRSVVTKEPALTPAQAAVARAEAIDRELDAEAARPGTPAGPGTNTDTTDIDGADEPV